MVEEDRQKNLINSIIFLIKLFVGLKDKFLAQKLYDKLSGLISGYIEFSRLNRTEGTSHNVAVKDLLNTTNNLLEFIDYLEHLKLVAPIPLLYSRRNLLEFKFGLIKLSKQFISSDSKEKENKPVSFPKIKTTRSDVELKESSNKEKILNFIKRSPNSRTKKIIEEFSILSERTVKRNLKELIDEGFVHKLTKDKGVYYAAL